MQSGYELKAKRCKVKDEGILLLFLQFDYKQRNGLIFKHVEQSHFKVTVTPENR